MCLCVCVGVTTYVCVCVRAGSLNDSSAGSSLFWLTGLDADRTHTHPAQLAASVEQITCNVMWRVAFGSFSPLTECLRGGNGGSKVRNCMLHSWVQ